MEEIKLKHPKSLYFLIHQFNKLLDDGNFIAIEELKTKIIDKELFNWLKDLYGTRLDVSFFSPIELIEFERLFAILSDHIDEERKMGIKKNGLCLLIAYCLELINNRPEELR